MLVWREEERGQEGGRDEGEGRRSPNSPGEGPFEQHWALLASEQQAAWQKLAWSGDRRMDGRTAGGVLPRSLSRSRSDVFH